MKTCQMATRAWSWRKWVASHALADSPDSCRRTFARNHGPFHAGQVEGGVTAGKMNPAQRLGTPLDDLSHPTRSNFRECTGCKPVSAPTPGSQRLQGSLARWSQLSQLIDSPRHASGWREAIGVVCTCSIQPDDQALDLAVAARHRKHTLNRTVVPHVRRQAIAFPERASRTKVDRGHRVASACGPHGTLRRRWCRVDLDPAQRPAGHRDDDVIGAETAPTTADHLDAFRTLFDGNHLHLQQGRRLQRGSHRFRQCLATAGDPPWRRLSTPTWLGITTQRIEREIGRAHV